MGTHDFLVVYACMFATILACRVIPLFVLKGRELSPRVREAIGLIPAAAFSALVANDLFQPQVLAERPLAGILPFVAAAPVLVVARKTGSLIWSGLVGMAVYAMLLSTLGLL